jgi:DNA recombination protein RmuC
MSVSVILIGLVALAVGAFIGWLLRAGALARAERSAAELPPLRLMIDGLTRERDALRAERDTARLDLVAARTVADRVEALERDLSGERARASGLAAEKAAFERGEAERARAHATQIAELDKRFGELAGKALGDAQKQFLERADQRFRESEQLSGERLGALLTPVHERLQRYEEGVARVEVERRDAFGTLHGLIQSMRDGQERVSGEAAKLVNALRNAPKARGRWGEQQLRNVLENCGLSEHADFQTEVSVDDQEGAGGRLRPDVIIRVPGGRALVIDAKVSLNAYQDAFGAVDEADRRNGLVQHAAAMRAHVNGLGAKAYWSQFADAPDYVIMFVPGEHFLSAALEQDPTLWDFAFEKRVLLATPTNLIAIARTVSAVWRQERLAKEAAQIGALGKELYDRLAKAAGDLRKVGGGLTSAVNNYNSFVSSFESRALVTARKFRDLNVETGAREMEEVAPVEVLARYGETAPALPSLGDHAEAAE